MNPSLAPSGEWLIEPLPTDVARLIERLRATEGVDRVAVLPDVHPSGAFCVGTVIASQSRVFPAAVGSDIGCGMMAQRFDARASDIVPDPSTGQRILRALALLVPTHRHGERTCPEALPEELSPLGLTTLPLRNRAARDGRVQLGTLGRGNHFLELQVDDEGSLWLMVHSGSRGMGQAITDHHTPRAMRDAQGTAYFEVGSEACRDYETDVAWARRYAECSREAMVTSVAVLLEAWFGVTADRDSRISCDHNHVAVEQHFGAEVRVHRKGALPAAEGQPGVISGSMGTLSYHVTGRGCARSLDSSSHGAGRRLRRSEAARQVSTKRLADQMGGVIYDRSLAKRLVEEAPSAYRDIERVMRAQRELTRITRRVRPILVHKGT